MAKKNFNLWLSLVACFAAFQASAMIVCIGLAIIDNGLSAIFPGITLWAVGQPIVLGIALVSMPVAVLLRVILGRIFDRPFPVALVTGGLVGAALTAFIAKDGSAGWELNLLVGLVAGVFGGWIWWLIESPIFRGDNVQAYPNKGPN